MGRIKDVPMRFILGHNARVRWRSLIDYAEDSVTGCWVWQRGMHTAGYGLAWDEGRPRLAHRVYYERIKGPIPVEAHGLDHLCRNRACVNPDHLQPVSNAVNSRRGAKTKLTWAAVREIRASPLSNAELARRFNVSGPTICNIRKNRRWVEGRERVWA